MPNITTSTKLSRKQARSIFGSNFTGVIFNQDGTFTPDSSAVQRISGRNTSNVSRNTKTPANTQDTGKTISRFQRDLNDPSKSNVVYPTGTVLRDKLGNQITVAGGASYRKDAFTVVSLGNDTGDRVPITVSKLPPAQSTQPKPPPNAPSGSPESFVVQPYSSSNFANSTLSGIAGQFGTTVNELLRLNPEITNPDVIQIGQQIKLPQRGNQGGTQGTPQGGQDRLAIIDGINADAVANENNDFNSLSSSLGNGVDISNSAKLAKALIESFSQRTRDKTPSLQEEVAKKRKELGVGGLETELAGLDQQIASLDADFASTIEGEDARKVSVLQIGRRQSQVELQYKRARRDLEVQRNGVANRLNQKLTVVSTMVKYLGADIDNARADYQQEFNSAISLTNLLRGIEKDAISQKEKIADNARANLQVMYGVLKKGNISYDKLDASTKIGISSSEIEAGLPKGFVKYVTESFDAPKVSFLSAFTDENGNRIQPVGSIGTDGTFSVSNVKLPKVKERGSDSTVISQATLNKLATAGVPVVVSSDIQRSLNEGKSQSIIRAHLVKQLGQQRGDSYMDAFLSVMETSDTGVLIP